MGPPSRRGACASSRRIVMRGQIFSAFGRELARLVAGVPGAHAAVLVDLEGETVDYAGDADAYEVRVMAAHLRLVLDAAQRQPSLRSTLFATVRTSRASYAVHGLEHGYALALWLSPDFRWSSAFEARVVSCARGLAHEAGWDTGRGPEWHALQVSTDDAGRPCRIYPRGSDRPETVEVVGRYVSGPCGVSLGWRVRLTSGPVGQEATLLHENADRQVDRGEVSSHWFIDALVGGAPTSRTRRTARQLMRRSPETARPLPQLGDAAATEAAADAGRENRRK